MKTGSEKVSYMKSKVWITFWLVIDILYTLFFGFIMSKGVNFDHDADAIMWRIFVISGILFTVISFISLILLIKGKKGIVGSSILTKLGVAAICFGAIINTVIENGSSAMVLFCIIGAILILPGICLIFAANHNSKFVSDTRRRSFGGFNASDFYGLVRLEMDRLSIIPKNVSLNKEEIIRINRYASTPFSYILYWLLCNNMLNPSFYSDKDTVSANDVVQGYVTPLEYFEKNCGFSMKREHLSEQCVMFIDRYYSGFFTAVHTLPDDDYFMADYAEAIRNEYGVFWTAEFDWEICRRMNDIISERFEKSMFRRESQFDALEFQTNENTIYFAKADEHIAVSSQNHADSNMLRKFENDLNSLDDLQFEHLGKMIQEIYYTQDPIGGLMPDTLFVFQNENGETAYAVSSLADYEQNNAIIFYFRNGIIFDWTVNRIPENPFSRIMQAEYENAAQCSDLSCTADEAVFNKLLHDGQLTTIILDDGREYYVTQYAAVLLEQCRMKVRFLQTAMGCDEEECECEFADGDIVPKFINVAAKRLDTGDNAFAKTIRIKY